MQWTPEYHFLPQWVSWAFLFVVALLTVASCWAVLHRDDVPTNPDPFDKYRRLP